MSRALRAKPQVPIVPCIVTDEDASSWPAVGLTGRRLREVVRALAVPFVRHGRRILVRVADLDEALVKNATIAGSANDTDTEHDDEPQVEHDDVPKVEQPPAATADAILASIGRRRS